MLGSVSVEVLSGKYVRQSQRETWDGNAGMMWCGGKSAWIPTPDVCGKAGPMGLAWDKAWLAVTSVWA